MGNLPKANKDLGQHFLRDKKIINTITSDYANEASSIVEIGPGPAILTKELAKHEKNLYVIEMDKRFEEYLKECTENIFFEDALNFNWQDFVKTTNEDNIWLVSNLPYNISSQLFISFLQVPAIKYMTLMYQKEVGEKTVLQPNKKNSMSSLTVLSMNYFESKILSKVSPGAFHPPPKVDSIVISYKRKKRPEVPLEEFSQFEAFLRHIFAFKRKQLGSVLKNFISSEKKDEIFLKTQIPPTTRAESLEFKDILALYQAAK